MSDQKKEHPCLKFQRGEVHDFETAMRVYIEQQVFETQQSRFYPLTSSERDEMLTSLKQVREATTKAQEIYDAIVRPAILEAANQMEAIYDLDLQAFARCLRQGDYSDLSL